MAVVSSCREMLGKVPQRAQPLSHVASVKDGDSWETAGDKSEEGGVEVKSSCPLCPGLHTCYIGRYKGLQTREGERIPKSRSRFGLEAETRLHEGGVASNRGLALPRGLSFRALSPPPATPRKSAIPEAGGLTRKGGS